MRRKGFFAQFFSLQLFWIFDKMGVLNFFFKKIPDFLGFCLTGELWLNCVLIILENYNNSIFWRQQKISCQNFQIFWRQNQWKKFRKNIFFVVIVFLFIFFGFFQVFFMIFFLRIDMFFFLSCVGLSEIFWTLGVRPSFVRLILFNVTTSPHISTLSN